MHPVPLLEMEEVVEVELEVVVAEASLGHQGQWCHWLQGRVAACLALVALF